MKRAMFAAVAALSIAHAAPAFAGEAADKAAAQKLLKEGNQLVGDGDYVAALEKFRAAHKRYPSAKLLLNIGTTLRQLGRNIEAAEAYEAYLKDPTADKTKVAGLERILQEINAVIARLRIEVADKAAKISLDGKVLPGFQSGTEIRVEPGDHTVVAEREGLPPAVQTLKLAPHEQRTITLLFAAPEKVLVAGPQRTIGIVFMGAGGAVLLAGGVAGVVAIAQNQAAKGHCATATICDQNGVDLGNAAKTSALVSTVVLAVGGGALVTGVVLYLTAPKGAKSDTPPAAPAAPAVKLGATLGGPFMTVEGTW